MWEVKATIFSTVCLLWIFCCTPAKAEVPPPGDLIMVTLNTNYTLSWNWNWDSNQTGEFSNITFTAEYIAKFRLKRMKTLKWTTACEEIKDRFCDLTPFNLYYQGLYSLRVRANMNGNHSAWEYKDFCPDKEAGIGPPAKVVLSTAGSHIDVFITDPITSTNGSMKEYLPDLYYKILYWEHDVEGEQGFNQQDPRIQTLNSNSNMVTLPKLRAWTWYCLSVQSRDNFYMKSSNFTIPHCMQTKGLIPWWHIFLAFMGSLLISLLCVYLSVMGWFWCCKTCRKVFSPQLPPHFKKCLLESTGSHGRHLVFSDSESELLCDHVTICPKPAILEVPNPPAEDSLPSDLKSDSGSIHSRQVSSSSVDSGVYSTGGVSAVQLSKVHQTITDLGDSCKGHQQMEEEVKEGLKHPPGITDENIMNMCLTSM